MFNLTFNLGQEQTAAQVTVTEDVPNNQIYNKYTFEDNKLVKMEAVLNNFDNSSEVFRYEQPLDDIQMTPIDLLTKNAIFEHYKDETIPQTLYSYIDNLTTISKDEFEKQVRGEMINPSQK